ncbi:MAG: glycoside hydrolase family 25 protein [Sphingomonadales bacterium]|nr:glycoside hydrolase family 25 protein [Sphingomonadales bacterium]
MQHWQPDTADFAEQGIEVGAQDGAVNFRTARVLGASFAYIDASDGAQRIDSAFSANLAAARAAHLRVGAVHLFDPCALADGQSANFVTVVPRGADMLPPVIELSRVADDCPHRVSEAAVESELMTLINQVESHAGKSVILKIMPGFEQRYHLAARLDRNLWLSRTGAQPAYAGRPWLLWTANEALRSEISDHPVRWVVVQP